LSLVFVRDLAQAVVTCLDHPAAAGKTYFVANPQIVTGRQMAAEIATQMRTWTIPVPLPTALFWPLCVGGEIMARLTGKARLLSLQKFAELRAPSWVCDSSLLRAETGHECKTAMEKGIAETLGWYRREGWL
jgi:nucleoside-diphosphate-sugar epimerase